MARKKKDGYMPKSEVLLILQNYIRTIQMNDYGTDSGIPQLYKAMDYIEDAPTADVVEVDDISKKIIRKKAEVSEYWQNDVKHYRATKGYSGIEHDVDNFLRGYNEAVEDVLAILDGARKDGDEDDL